MNSVSVSCNNCGAALNVINKTKFVTCNYCKSQLKVQSSGETYYTEILDEIKDVADDVETIKLQNKLERLDREWEMKRRSFMVRDNDGHERIPTAGGSAAGGIVAVVGGIIWMVFTASMPGAPAIFPLFGLVFIAVGVIGSFSNGSKATDYQTAKQQYDAKRRQLLNQLKDR